MKTRQWVVALALAAAMSSLPAQTPAEFAWRGTLQAPANATLIRASLPADALLRLRSSQAADVRVFDASGKGVPFAFATPVDQPPAARQPTSAFNALAMFTAQAGSRIPRSGVKVNVRDGAQRSVWVQMDTNGQAATDPAGATRLPSALFDTRSSKQRISALVIKAQVPANAPVRFALETSTDLAQWTPVPLRGRVFHFDGDNAPANDTLELEQPLALQGQYLRLEWSGQEGVTVSSFTGLVAPPAAPAPRVSAALPAGVATPGREGMPGLEWQLPSATPLAALALTTAQPNTLMPVRVLGRNQISEPWRQIGQGIVFRLGQGAAESTSLPLALARTSVRWLRVEATHGQRLENVPLAAAAVFDPVELVFVAGGNGPYELAAGRAETAAVALPLGMVSSVANVRIDELPVSRIASFVLRPESPPSALQGMLPAGVDSKSALLWAVLLAAVALLGGVAWSLMKTLNKARPADEA
jgi:hypothetical protein